MAHIARCTGASPRPLPICNTSGCNRARTVGRALQGGSGSRERETPPVHQAEHDFRLDSVGKDEQSGTQLASVHESVASEFPADSAAEIDPDLSRAFSPETSSPSADVAQPITATSSVFSSRYALAPSPRPPAALWGDLMIASLAVLGVRAGRLQSEETRRSLSYWQRREEWLESAAGELHRARLEYERKQAKDRAEAEKEMKRAADEARKAAAERERERAEAREGQKRAEAALEEQRRAFMEKERQLREEMEKREKEARDEVRKRLRDERAEKEKVVMERREKERAQREEKAAEEERQREEERRAAEERRQRIRAQSVKVTMPLSGTVTVSAAPRGTLVDPTGILSDQATIQATVSAGSLSGGTTEQTFLFRDLADARKRSAECCSEVAEKAVGGWVGAAVVKRMGGAGPLNGMDDIEVEAFGRAARLRLEASLCDALLRGVGEFGGKDWQGRVKAATVQLRLAEAEGREEDTVQGRMREARVLVQEGVRKAAVRRALMPLVADQEEQLADGMELASLSTPAGKRHLADPRLAAAPLALAHWLARVLDERPRGEAGASPWFEASIAVAKEVLDGAMEGVGEDALTPVSDAVMRILGESHPMSVELERMARARMSREERDRRETERALEEERRIQRMLEEEWPEYAERARMRAEETEAAIPAPERAWALRNVAMSSGNLDRARRMMRQGLGYMEGHLESPSHPGLLADLLTLARLCDRSKDSEPACAEESVQIWRRIASIALQQAQEKIDAGNEEAAAWLLVGAAEELGGALGQEDEAVKRVQALGRSLLGAMSDEARGAVTAGAGHASGGTLDALAAEHEIRIEARRDFEKELQERHRRSMRQ